MKTPDEVLAIDTLLGLRQLTLSDFEGRRITAHEIRHFLDLTGAGWIHPSGKPTAPHVVLTSGLHSNGYFDVLRMLKHTNLCLILGHQMAEVIKEAAPYYCNPNPMDWCIGSDHAGTAFSHTVGTALGLQHDYPRKGPEPEKKQIWERHQIASGEMVLQIEELMTTAKTFLAVRQGIRERNILPVEFSRSAGVLVHRSDVETVEDTRLVWLVHFDITNWNPKEGCQLCDQGSPAIDSPKTHWAELTGKA